MLADISLNAHCKHVPLLPALCWLYALYHLSHIASSTTDMLYGTIGARRAVSEKLADWAVQVVYRVLY